MHRKRLVLAGMVLVLLVFAAFPFVANANERILSFDVTAKLQNDASMVVTERIRANIKQIVIRHGITHAFPVKEVYDGRKLKHYGFELLSVKLDGKPVNYYENSAGYYTGIAVGTKGRGAPLGDHTYEIVYKTTGHVRPMQDRDEIYYNVMGNNWALPVDKVSFTLQLPGGGSGDFIDAVAYTGALGESGDDYVLEGKDTVRTTRTLQPGEGLTVAIAWKKGLVTLPEESFANIVGAHRTPVLLGIFVTLLFAFVIPRRVCTRIPKGVVVPLFSAPEGMSPGYMAALKALAYKGAVLHADIIWSAVNGFMRVDARKKKKILLQKKTLLEEPKRMKSGGEWARKECEALRDDLFWGLRDEVDLSTKEGKDLATLTFEFLERKYSKQQEGLWEQSYIPAVPGAILFLALFSWALTYIYSPMLDLGEDYGGTLGYVAILGAMFGLVGFFVWGARRAVRTTEGLLRVGLLIAFPLLAIGTLAAIWAISEDDYFFLLIFAASLGMAVWCIFNVPGRLTKKGREKYLPVQGLEMYIRTAEKNRLAKLNAPEDTVEKFEELLPYAIALGCAEAWKKRFDTMLADIEFKPDWLVVEGDMGYFRSLSVVTGVTGMAAAANFCAKLSHANKPGTGGGSSSGGSGFGSGERRGSVGGGSGGSNVGGW